MQQGRPELGAMTFDEVSLERSKGFVQALQELKNLRPQLYSAAEYCEKSYLRSEQKQMVVDNLKEYGVRALVNVVDHLGTVAYKLTDLSEQQSSDMATVEQKISCLCQAAPTVCSNPKASQTLHSTKVDDSKVFEMTADSCRLVEETTTPLPLSSYLQAAKRRPTINVASRTFAVKDPLKGTKTVAGFESSNDSGQREVCQPPARNKSILSALFPRNKSLKPKRLVVS
ncbi:hypothetical protein C4D60_Mb07t02830 [Musa balbisiana]|uniref:Protein ABIL1 n=1 Tax=Musa balbisiana TaxID=52838 RepID=A0A4V4H6E2_MUSBA|nr:hypothetical protein C4D60_Mb07t02830 [Musa balbisiana]